MIFGGKHISKTVISSFSKSVHICFCPPIYEQLCHLCLFEGTLGQHERTRAKENELLIGDVVRVETCLEGAFKIVTKK